MQALVPSFERPFDLRTAELPPDWGMTAFRIDHLVDL
jgi:hypothetical protein